MTHKRLLAVGGTILAVMSAGCAPRPELPPTPTKTPNPALEAIMAGPTLQPATEATTETLPAASSTDPSPVPETEAASTGTPTPSVTGTPTVTLPPPTRDASLPAEHYWLLRPIQTGWTDYGDRTYAYGSTAGGQYRPHTGMEFWNPVSTPVIAVGNGMVEYAGADDAVVYGPEPNFYGNLIVLRLTDFNPNGKALYVLYAHLSEIYVQTGQAVAPRDIIGAVGATGIAAGPHLHFEVRVGDPLSYFTSTRNPDLWIKAYYGYGTLAGRVVDAAGNYLPEVALTVHGPDAVRYTWSYSGQENIPDDGWRENFTLGDLPEGWYTVTTRSSTRSYSVEVYIENGHTTWLELVF